MIKITEHRAHDLVALQELFLRIRRSTFVWAELSKFELSDFDKETEGEYILVARMDEKPIGFIAVWVADRFIHHLYVDEAYQNQQIGTQLLNAIISKFGLPLRLKCEEKNTKAINFYQRKGFVEIEKGQSQSGLYILFELR